MLSLTITANAAVIQHSADRYIINVDQMDLNGEETVLDILMMLPDVITIDGKAVISGDVNSAMQKRMFGQYAVRVDNMNIHINPEIFIKNTKAKDVKCIKICTNPGVQKGCGGLKQVIDIYYRQHDAGNEGRVAIKGDSYGKANIYATDWKTADNYSLHTYAIGNLENRKYDADCGGNAKVHASQEQLRAHLNWNITEKDNNIIVADQSFFREKEVGGAPAFSRSYNFEDCYTRDLDNGAYVMFQAGVDYNHDNSVGIRTLNTNPYGLIELGAPFISNNLYLNGGVEGGYTGTTVGEGDIEVTSRESYEDIYAQLDWNCGKFNLSIGDRVRFASRYLDKAYTSDKWSHTAVQNHYTVSSWVNMDDNNIIQATFARRFYGPNIPTLNAFLTGAEVTASPIYTAEMRYTYQKQDFNVMGIVKNIHLNEANNTFSENLNHDNILQVGASAYYHKDFLRLTVGIDYNWQKSSYTTGTKYNNFVNLKLVPQVSLSDGLRFTSTLIYNSRKAYDSEFYAPANFYAEVGASKEFNENWLVEAKFHDIAGQHYGNRGISVGATYSF